MNFEQRLNQGGTAALKNTYIRPTQKYIDKNEGRCHHLYMIVTRGTSSSTQQIQITLQNMVSKASQPISLLLVLSAGHSPIFTSLGFQCANELLEAFIYNLYYSGVKVHFWSPPEFTTQILSATYVWRKIKYSVYMISTS